ncbi:PQQ-dependent sugar dehydrogenase [Daejeonella oryzae]|uniref:PQQ-dependent sugar dehydrogenase n=1 Tax=Daejeonella oryzae TaxID=1122943 RepID=UPI0003FA8697|nr:sorbosone dehydrogenase family protein [Daejeonella oryzae]
MKKLFSYSIILSITFCIQFCAPKTPVQNNDQVLKSLSDSLDFPPAYHTKSVRNFSKVIGWPLGKTPIAPSGFMVNRYAEDFISPRWMYVCPNGDVLVAEANTELGGFKKMGAKILGITKSQRFDKSANRITLLRDSNGDGKADLKKIFLSGLNQPFGMLIINKSLYVANTDGLWKYPYENGQTEITRPGTKILSLPAGGYNNHWTRNIITNADSSKIYISVGSGSNVGENGMENEVRRACILEINLDGSGEIIYAAGIRNPVGMGFAPGTSTLWTSVNERDELGDDLVPDYFTSVKKGGFYGWPYSYFGQYVDPRPEPKRPDLVKKSIVPDIALGSHTASLGLAFYDNNAFPQKYRGGAFIGQHGSWNRSEISGYKVVFVPFSNGKPTGKPEDFLTGFISDKQNEEVYGRPVGITVLPDGSLLVADDASNIIWRVSSQK